MFGIVVTDRDGIIRSVSHNNGDLDSSLIGAKWYDTFSIPVEESHRVEEENPKIFRLYESGKKYLYLLLMMRRGMYQDCIFW